jgi:hypothetical protein
VARELTLLFHFIGFGLLATIATASFILDRQYHKAPDLASKAAILRAARPIGLLSPIAVVLQILTGIGNMQALGLGVFTMGWLSAKLVIFVVAASCGMYIGIVSRKRGALVGQMSAGKPPAGAEATLSGYDSQLRFFGYLMPVLLLSIVYLSVYGRLGGQ